TARAKRYDRITGLLHPFTGGAPIQRGTNGGRGSSTNCLITRPRAGWKASFRSCGRADDAGERTNVSLPRRAVLLPRRGRAGHLCPRFPSPPIPPGVRAMTPFDLPAYAPAVQALLAEPRLAPLGPGRANRAARPLLESLDDRMFEPQAVRDRDLAAACRA